MTFVSPISSSMNERVPMVSERFWTAPMYLPVPDGMVSLAYSKVPCIEDVSGSVDFRAPLTSLTLPVKE